MSETILVVDDEIGMQTALKEVLTRKSYEVLTASDGEQAKEILKSEKVAAMITDVRMPEMSGIELLEWINKEQLHLPVIIMTAYGTIDDAVDAMRKGACDYILKPFSPIAVLEALSRALAMDKSNRQPKPEGNSTPRISKDADFIAFSQPMLDIKTFVGKIADSRATILIQGESGTGKEVLAKYIHRVSTRSAQPFIAINCAALPAGLLESELFGHEKGSFTGAVVGRKGKFELADHGTILLDEISEMEPVLQAKLLRVLQEFEIFPLGSAKPVILDIRVIATTNRNLEELVAEGKFREDLYYRLNVVPVEIPPLRIRGEDIVPLCGHFLKKLCKRNNRSQKKLAPEVVNKIMTMEWKGNVRELENFIERAILLTKSDIIGIDDLFLRQGVDAAESRHLPLAGLTLDEMEKRLILNTLKIVNNNRTKAADMLGVSVRTIRNKINQYAMSGGGGRKLEA